MGREREICYSKMLSNWSMPDFIPASDLLFRLLQYILSGSLSVAAARNPKMPIVSGGGETGLDPAKQARLLLCISCRIPKIPGLEVVSVTRARV